MAEPILNEDMLRGLAPLVAKLGANFSGGQSTIAGQTGQVIDTAASSVAMQNMINKLISPAAGNIGANISGVDVMGLTPDIVSSAYGIGLKNKAVEGDNLGRAVQAMGHVATLADMPVTSAYKQALTNQAIQATNKSISDMKAKEAEITNFKDSISGWEKFMEDPKAPGAIKPPAWAKDPGNLSALKSLPHDEAKALMSTLVKAYDTGGIVGHAFNDKTGELVGWDKTGIIKMRENMQPSPDKTGKTLADQLGAYKLGMQQAVSDNYSQLESDFIKSGGSKAALGQLMLDMSDPNKSAQAYSILVGKASPRTKTLLKNTADAYVKSLAAGTGFSGANTSVEQDVAVPVKVDREKAKKLAIEIQAKTGKTPTPQELSDEYVKKYGR